VTDEKAAAPLRARMGEARRNRQRLVEVATRAFGSDRPVTLAEIAAEAGVGIGTLYRHFPTREALVEAVYHDQVERLGRSATELLAAHPPAEAFRRWLDVFVDWAATKHGMTDALRTAVSSGRLRHSEMRRQLETVVGRLLEAGAESGELRGDASAADVAALLAGILSVAGAPDQRDQARRLAALVADGLQRASG